MKKTLATIFSLVLVLSRVVVGNAEARGGKDKGDQSKCQEPFSSTQDPLNLFSVFDPEYSTELFKSMDSIMPYNVIEAGGKVKDDFKTKIDKGILNTKYSFLGEKSKVSDLLTETSTNAIIVMKKDKIIAEEYYNGYDACSNITSWSVAKSFLSIALGVAVEEGKIGSINDLVTQYVPSLEGSAYAGVTIKQVLEMSSGVKFDEDYTNLDSDINQLMPYLVLDEGSVDSYTGTLENQAPPGTHVYKSIDTQVIGMIIKGATGVPAAEYIETKIWKPLGMSSDAFWNTDLQGNEISFAMLNAKAKDYARFGQLMLNDGKYNGNRIISKSWIKESVTPGRAELQPGVADPYFGYGYQWWVPMGAKYGEEFVAIGIYGQYIYVNKKEDVVITKFSADPAIIMNDAEVLEAFRAIAKKA